MAERMPVRCPACRREHLYAAPALPCACGAPVAAPLEREVLPVPVTRDTWDADWVTLRCPTCGRRDRWPQPELSCPCGALLRLPVAQEPAGRAGPGLPPHIPLPHTAPRPRPAFQPVAVRTARDAVAAAALYLRWLGYQDVRRADHQPPTGVALRARGMVAHVEAGVRPAQLREVECLWLTALAEPADCACFTLAGYADAARRGADDLRVPLLVIDLTGTPQPVNSAADELISTGAPR